MSDRQNAGTRPGRGRRIQAARTGLVLWSALLLATAALVAAAPAKKPAPARPAPPVAELARIRFWTAPENTRLVLDLTRPLGSEPQFRLADSLTFEIYLPRARKSAAVTTEFVGDSLVADIFPAVSETGTSVRVRLKRPTTPLGFTLPASEGNPDRIVVDVPAPPNPEAEKQLVQKVTELKRSKRGTAARTRVRSATGGFRKRTSRSRSRRS